MADEMAAAAGRVLLLSRGGGIHKFMYLIPYYLLPPTTIQFRSLPPPLLFTSTTWLDYYVLHHTLYYLPKSMRGT